jgi:hypothetical protein
LISHDSTKLQETQNELRAFAVTASWISLDCAPFLCPLLADVILIQYQTVSGDDLDRAPHLLTRIARYSQAAGERRPYDDVASDGSCVLREGWRVLAAFVGTG